MYSHLDQIHADLLSPKHLAQRVQAKPAEELPGLGRFYCIECAKWFESEHSLVHHRRGRPHKRRLRALKEEPYTQKEADAAAGLATDNGVRKNAKINEGREEVPMDIELANG